MTLSLLPPPRCAHIPRPCLASGAHPHRSIADAGVKVVVTGGTISEMALHFLERYKVREWASSTLP